MSDIETRLFYKENGKLVAVYGEIYTKISSLEIEVYHIDIRKFYDAGVFTNKELYELYIGNENEKVLIGTFKCVLVEKIISQDKDIFFKYIFN